MPRIFGKQFDWKNIFCLASILLSLGILFYFCISENGLISLLKQFHKFQTVWIVAAVFCVFADLFLDTCLIYFFIRSKEPKYHFRSALKVCLAGHFYGAITPSQSGSQPAQIYLMTRQGIDPGNVASALVQKFFVYQTSITLYSLLAISLQINFFRNALTPAMWGLAFLGFAVQAAVAILLLLISLSEKLTHRLLAWAGRLPVIRRRKELLASWEKQLEFFHQSNRLIYRNVRLLGKTYLLTFLQLTAIFMIPYCVYRTFDIGRVPMIQIICSQAFVTMVASLFPLPGSSGAAETSFYSFFSSSFTPDTIKSADLLWRAVSYYLVILICAPFARIGKKLQPGCG